MGEIYGKLFNGHTLDENKWDNLSILKEDKAIKVDIFGMVIFIQMKKSTMRKRKRTWAKIHGHLVACLT